MKKTAKNFFLFFTLLGALLLLNGCGAGSKPRFPEAGPLTMTMINNSDQEVHMWVSIREKIGPRNKLETGKERSVGVLCEWVDESTQASVTVSVGKNGQTMKTAVLKLTLRLYSEQCKRYTAKYTNTGDLVIKPDCVY